MNKKTRIFSALGLICVSGGLIIKHMSAPSHTIDFIRGLLLGLGIVFLVFSMITNRTKK
jgi:hypothetical protein